TWFFSNRISSVLAAGIKTRRSVRELLNGVSRERDFVVPRRLHVVAHDRIFWRFTARTALARHPGSPRRNVSLRGPRVGGRNCRRHLRPRRHTTHALRNEEGHRPPAARIREVFGIEED